MYVAVPSAVAGRNVKECDALAVTQITDFILQPSCFLLPVPVTLDDSVIFDVGVRFVFTAVQRQEADACCIEGVVELSSMSREVFVDVVSILSSVLVVSSYEDDRGVLREHVHACVQPSVEDSFFVFGGRKHVAVQQDEVIL